MEFLAGQAYAALRGFGVLNREGEARRLFHDYRQMRQAYHGNALMRATTSSEFVNGHPLTTSNRVDKRCAEFPNSERD